MTERGILAGGFWKKNYCSLFFLPPFFTGFKDPKKKVMVLYVFLF